MTRWAVIFRDTPEMLEIRADQERRDAHVAYAKSHPELLIGGGLKPSAEADFCGALWIVEADTSAEVERLVREDPFFVPKLREFEIYLWGKILEDRTVTL
ncbi:MAG: YciI family protein [Pseudomonadota bacterium]